MSISELKTEVDRLSPEERHQLRAYLTLKDEISDEKFLKGLSEKMNDRSPERRLDLAEFEKTVER
jgi:hypothetical protein